MHSDISGSPTHVGRFEFSPQTQLANPEPPWHVTRDLEPNFEAGNRRPKISVSLHVGLVGWALTGGFTEDLVVGRVVVVVVRVVVEYGQTSGG